MKRNLLLLLILTITLGLQNAYADRLVASGNVPSNGKPTNQINLTNGKSYYIVVSGAVTFGTWSNGKKLLNDACYEFNAKGYLDPLPVFQNNYNIIVCDNYNPNHIYKSAPFVSSGQPINFWIYDTDYRDNSGGMHLELYEIEQNKIILGTVNSLVQNSADTGHQVQCWKVDPSINKAGLWKLSMQHSVAGHRGGFYLMAWADTNGDGLPDYEIGRSNLMISNQSMAWSSWEFRTRYDSIYIGNSWQQKNELVYYQMGGSAPEGYTGLSDTVYYSRKFNGRPNFKARPRYSNIRLEYVGK